MGCIDTSIFDLFKIGPGPSSSHTIGPMKAGIRFLNSVRNLNPDIIAKADSMKVHLYGSLSSTGKGHGTDRSILAGLLGWEPASCDSEEFSKLLRNASKIYLIDLKAKNIRFNSRDIIFDKSENAPYPYQNTVVFQLQASGKVLFEKEYYSIGGGFILCKGEKEHSRPKPLYRYSNMEDLKKLIKKHNIKLPVLIEKNEAAISEISRQNIRKQLNEVIISMEDAVRRGLKAKGVLPGKIKLSRKAHILYKKAESRTHIHDRFLALLNAYAFAASEENAAGHKVVTAPTSGSAGVIPAAVYLLKNHFFYAENKICDGLLSAAAIGFIAKHNASISGAEVGCQGEIGVASAMAAALFAAADGHPVNIIENAAEIALEHHLGLTCDPIDGYVQIPCIERNAVGIVTAYNAFLLASTGDPHKQKVTFDDVVKAMLLTGKDMSTKYKETAKGGLAVCKIKC